MLIGTFLRFCIFIGLSTALLDAQTPATTVTIQEPPELQKLRQQLNFQLSSSARNLAEQYRKALYSIEQDAAKEGDYTEAQAALDKQLSIEKVYSISNLNYNIPLPFNSARLSGSVNFDTRNQQLINWRTIGSTAIWDVNRVVAGSYHVSLVYSVAPLGNPPPRKNDNYSNLTGGSFEFYEDSNLPGASQNRRAFTVSNTGSWEKFKRVTSTTPITLTRTSARFGLRISQTNGDGGVMNLKEVTLIPVTKLNLPTQVFSQASLTILEEFQAHSRNLISEQLHQHLQTVQAREENARALDYPEHIRPWSQEIAQIKRLLERSSFPPINSNQMLEAHEVWENVTYDFSKPHVGNSFTVQYEGKPHQVVLQFVQCPDESSSAAEQKAYQDYFKLHPDQASLIINRYQELLSDTLKGKTFTVIHAGRKSPQDYLYVSIKLPHLGDLAGILVDNGLVMIESRKSLGSALQNAHFERNYLALQEREQKARHAQPTPGAWAFTQKASSSPP